MKVPPEKLSCGHGVLQRREKIFPSLNVRFHRMMGLEVLKALAVDLREIECAQLDVHGP